MFPDGGVVVLARNQWCFQMDMHVLQTRAPRLLQGIETRYMLLPYLRQVHVIRLNNSHRKVRSFLNYLCNLVDPEALAMQSSEHTFRDLKGLYLMAREWEEPALNEQSLVAMAVFHRWLESKPLEVFAMACRATRLHTLLAERAILNFHNCVPTVVVGRPQSRITSLFRMISVGNMTALRMEAKIQERYIRAYERSYQAVFEDLVVILESRGQQSEDMCKEIIRAALVVLARFKTLGIMYHLNADYGPAAHGAIATDYSSGSSHRGNEDVGGNHSSGPAPTFGSTDGIFQSDD